MAHLTNIQFILYHCRQSLVFVSYTRRMSTIFTIIKWPHDVLMQTVTVLAGGIQYTDLSPGNLRTFCRNASPTLSVSCRTLKQWNNNLPKFHFRLKEEMLDYYHDVQYLMQGRGSASYTSWSPVHLGSSHVRSLTYVKYVLHHWRQSLFSWVIRGQFPLFSVK